MDEREEDDLWNAVGRLHVLVEVDRGLPEAVADDVRLALRAAERFLLTNHRLEALDAAQRAYQTTEGNVQQKQAAACRVLGLTSTEGRKSDALDFLKRWFGLTTRAALATERLPDGQRETERTRLVDEAVKTIAKERGVDEASVISRLRKIQRDRPPGLEWWADRLDPSANTAAAIPKRKPGPKRSWSD